MRDLDDLLAALGRSEFRRRMRLGAKERAVLAEKTLPVVLEHARRFVTERLAPAKPRNDGRQTPMRGHPVFIAQHATAGDTTMRIVAAAGAWPSGTTSTGGSRLRRSRLNT